MASKNVYWSQRRINAIVFSYEGNRCKFSFGGTRALKKALFDRTTLTTHFGLTSILAQVQFRDERSSQVLTLPRW